MSLQKSIKHKIVDKEGDSCYFEYWGNGDLVLYTDFEAVSIDNKALVKLINFLTSTQNNNFWNKPQTIGGKLDGKDVQFALDMPKVEKW